MPSLEGACNGNGAVTVATQLTNLDLHIEGIGVAYPPFQVGPDALETIAKRFYPTSTALSKVLTINQYTGIETRSAIGDVDHPSVNQPKGPTIEQLHDIFYEYGVPLSVTACQNAIKEWGGSVNEITHVISTTCTNSANPGFDHFVVKRLGISQSVEKVLLHGVGCSGGLAALRTASNLALGESFRRRPARILVLACEISSVLVRSELDSIVENEEVRIGPCLFSDCASAVVLSNGIGDIGSVHGDYELLGWKHKIIPDSEKELGFDVHPSGWKVVLSQKVPKMTAAAVAPIFKELIGEIPELRNDKDKLSASDLDWALHPGGSTIITGVQAAMNLTEDHLRASYDVYINHGNSSSATIFSILKRLREMGEGKEYVVALAFGPGIAVEMMIFRRRARIDDLIVESLD
ncbi:MAG: hypothetical protein M1827_006606 [Pycnora praestabilis]|nr:MAG: hypothetical protein M1827_006606 [Pycnora praestabilis]